MAQFNGTNGDDIFTGGSDNDTAVGNGGNDSLSGAGGNDLLVGSSGADTLNGGDGDDRLYSGGESVSDTGADHDVLIGGDGSDTIYAGYGDDVDGGAGGSYGDFLSISFLGAPSGVTFDMHLATQTIGDGTITGIENVTVAQGSNFDDTIDLGGSGNGYGFGQIYGMGGNDHLVAGYYTNLMDGGDGNDILDGQGSQYLNEIDGGAGDDTIDAPLNENFAVANGGDGNDTITSNFQAHGGAGNDTIVMKFGYYGTIATGDAGDDQITAAESGSTISGGSGADIINGNSGGDRLSSAESAPTTNSFVDDVGLEQDVVAGFGGDDTIAIGYGDSADGGSGNDTLRLSLGGSTSGVVFDTGTIGSGGSVAFAGATLQNFENFEYLRGSQYVDALTIQTQSTLMTVDAGAGDDVIASRNSSVAVSGGAGNDVFITGAAGDTFDGGNGIDTVDYQQAAAGVTVTFSGIAGTGAGGDSFVNVENAYGSSFNDTLTGSDAANELRGGAGDDSLSGGGGADVLTGGTGTDTLAGGAGADTFKDTSSALNGDTITDFSNGDKIVFADASIANFSFSLSGHTLSFTGGSLALTAVPVGNIVASAAADGGVQLTILAEVRNDFNGDGRSDVLWRNDSGQVTDWLGQSASGGFASNFANADANAGIDWHISGTGDFDGDGRADVLWRNNNGDMTNWLGQASGSFASNFGNAFYQVDNSWHVAGTGDFNGDGRDDILWRNDSGRVTDWLGQAGSGGFVSNFANADANAGTDWHIVATGDFNGDGRDDVLWRNNNGDMTDWLGQANGGFASNFGNAFYQVDNSWHVAGTGDFNGDGISDILWRNDSGRVTDWLGQAGSGGFVSNFANADANAGTDWHIVSTGDYNGDGRDDVLWRNDNGDMTDWLGQPSGSFASNFGNAFYQVDNSWHVQDPFL
jgi:Ca2+-binding RTX toxin-like protein